MSFTGNHTPAWDKSTLVGAVLQTAIACSKQTLPKYRFRLKTCRNDGFYSITPCIDAARAG